MRPAAGELRTSLILLALVWTMATPAAAGSESSGLLGDAFFTSRAGAQTLLTLHHVAYTWEEQILPASLWDENLPPAKLGAVCYRLAKTILLDNVYDHLTFLLQHEVFGHGSGYREIGSVDNSYNINLVFPYGNNHGFARLGTATRWVSNHEQLAHTVGGNEANTVLSHAIRDTWLARGVVHYREVPLYSLSSADLLLYILGTYTGIQGTAGNDVLHYLSRIDPTTGIPERPKLLSIEQLALASLVTLADPFLYVGLATFLWQYLWKGSSAMRLPMIGTDAVRYLPAFHFSLSPFGPEFHLKNYFLIGERPVCVSLRVGQPMFHTFFGGGVDATRIVDNVPFGNGFRVSVDGSLHAWYQPVFDSGGDYPRLPAIPVGESSIGGYVSITTRLWFLGDVGLSVQMGYKSSGHMEGELLHEGPFIRAGLVFHSR